MVHQVLSSSDQLFKSANTFFETNNNSTAFQNPFLFKTFKNTNGFNPFLYVSLNKNSGEVDGLLMGYEQTLVKLCKIQFSRNVIIGGPLAKNNTHSIIKDLLKKYLLNIKRTTVYTEIRNNSITDKALYNSLGFNYYDHLNYEIDLTQPLETIWEGFKKNTKKSINQAKRKGIIVKKTDDFQDFLQGYILLKTCYNKIAVPLPRFEYFDNIRTFFSPDNKFFVYKAIKDNKIVGVSFRLFFKDRVLAWYTAVNSKYKKYNVHDALHWFSIQQAQKHGAITYDFGGAGHPSKDYGPRKYKAKFSGTLTNYGRYYFIHRPFLMKFVETGYYIWKKIKLFL